MDAKYSFGLSPLIVIFENFMLKLKNLIKKQKQRQLAFAIFLFAFGSNGAVQAQCVPSTSPTGISGSTSICKGSSVTLTATGGTLNTGGSYQWGTGSSIGSNIIANQNGVTLTVSPSALTTYWVRIKPNSCNTQGWLGATITVAVAIPSTAPTTITGVTSLCSAGTNTQLTASGGIIGVTDYNNAPYQWGTGTVGTNIIADQKEASIWVAPTTTTTYWVRRVDPAPCNTATAAVTVVVNVAVTPTSITGDTTICNGASTTLTAVGGQLAATGSYRWGIGYNYDSSTTIVGETGPSITVTPSENTTYWVRLYTSDCTAQTWGPTIGITVKNPGGSAPTAISGIASICSGASTTLTANGANGGTYQWGTGTVGSNIISGQSSASITVSPLSTTTYWVRRYQNSCSNYSAGISKQVVVNALVAGTVSPSQSVSCQGLIPSDLTLTAYTGSILKWQKATNAAFTAPVDIASTAATVTGAQIGNLTTTTYFRAVISGSCGTVYSPVATVAVSATTWTGAAWTNGVPTSASTAIIAGNYTSSGNIVACTMRVINNAVVVISSGNNLDLTGALTVEEGSSLTLNSNSNLVQSSSAVNSGKIVVKRDSNPLMRLDYTIWSSPVDSEKLLDFSPLTVSNRFYTYNPLTDLYNVIDTPANQNFESGKGYLIRMPNTHPATPTVWTGVFNGIPNNGDVTIDVVPGSFNAVGNPYPSTVDTDAFIEENNIHGAMFFWRKTNNASNSSYATYTLAGGAANGHGFVSGDPLGLVPNGVFQVGQGFIVKATSATLKFKNSMRIINTNNQFFKTATASRSRIWVNLTNADGFFSQTMVAYMANATSGEDNAIDGRYFNDSQTALTSIINDSEFSIQGRPLPFDTNDKVALGFKTSQAGTFSISLDHVDGLFGSNQPVYLRDKLTNSTHDFSTGAYNFSTTAGVFNTRFEIVYQNTLAVAQPAFDANAVVVYKQNQSIVINAANQLLAEVKVFDIRGRLLAQKKAINTTETTIQAGNQNEVLLLQIVLQDGIILTKKVIR